MLAVSTHGTPAFASMLARLQGRGDTDFAKVEDAVRAILADVRTEGDVAVLRYIDCFEKRTVEPKALFQPVTALDGAGALARLPADARGALEHAAARITRFHERERSAMFPEGGFRFEEEGLALGLRVQPLERVGVYAPGGKARYPSSVLMSAIP